MKRAEKKKKGCGKRRRRRHRPIEGVDSMDEGVEQIRMRSRSPIRARSLTKGTVRILRRKVVEDTSEDKQTRGAPSFSVAQGTQTQWAEAALPPLPAPWWKKAMVHPRPLKSKTRG